MSNTSNGRVMFHGLPLPTTRQRTRVSEGFLHLKSITVCPLATLSLAHSPPIRKTFSNYLPTEEGDIQNAHLFAIAVRTSTTAFVQLAKNHDQYLKEKSAALLNQHGFPRVFAIGDLVKARFPPTKAELDATGRRLNHVSSWRGPCKVVDRLSATTYRVMNTDTLRHFERAVSNLLPWKATSAKKACNATYDPETSAPFVVNEFIAVRDDPASWFYIARVSAITTTMVIVHYYGSRTNDLKKAKFLPA
jgi:hypothetical protein